MDFVYGTKSYKGESAYTRAEALEHFRTAAAITTLPFIYLSAGVSNPVFIETLELAAESGVAFNGVLCGRATWKDGIAIYAKQGARRLPQVARHHRRRKHPERKQGPRSRHPLDPQSHPHRLTNSSHNQPGEYTGRNMPRTLARFLGPLAAALLLAPIAAPSQNLTIAKVIFHNPGPYTDAELLTTSGLAPGQFLLRDSLVNAATHLLNTGLFTDAQVDYSGTGKAQTVTIDLKPIPLDKLLPASFANLIWFTPAELTAGIHARVPLYRGVASDAGNLPDAIQSALQQMLTAKGITATLSHEIVEPTDPHPIRVVSFQVVDPHHPPPHRTPLHARAPPEPPPRSPPACSKPPTESPCSLQRRPHRSNHRGRRTHTRTTAPDTSTPRSRTSSVAPTPTPKTIAVTYTATFVPGDEYKVSTITWNPTPLYSAADFARDAKLHPGDPRQRRRPSRNRSPISRLPPPGLHGRLRPTQSSTRQRRPHSRLQPHRSPRRDLPPPTVNVIGLSPQARQQFDPTGR